MALKPKRPRVWLSRLHLLLRLIGLTGLVAIAGAGVLAQVQGMFGTDETPWREAVTAVGDRLWAALEGQAEGDALARATVYVVLGGAAVALLWLLVEALVILRFAAARRGAFGANAVVQAGIAAALLVGINLYSYFQYLRVDCTRHGDFTLPSDVQEQFRQLRPEAATTILVLLQPTKAVSTDNRDDHLASAAEKIVLNKVRELADELRDFGPQFYVVVLDTREEDYPDKLEKVTKPRPGLEQAIKNAPPGNNLFFYAPPDRRAVEKREQGGEKEGEKGAEGAHIQRLSFEDFYQLDRARSKKADNDRGNLVLQNKGVRPLARRIWNLEEKRPRVGILVAHEAFSTENKDSLWGLDGLKQSLTRYGFEVRDVILKRNLRRNPRTGALQADPAVALLDETRYRRNVVLRDRLPEAVKGLTKEIEENKEVIQRWKKATPQELKKLANDLGVSSISEAFRRRQIEAWEYQIESTQRERDRLHKELNDVKERLGKVNEDVVEEQLRMTDLRPKLERVVADCDLLLIPRPSLWMFGYPDDVHRLEPFQLDVIRDFIKSGKPVLACLGSRGEPPPRFGAPPPPPTGPDGLEDLLAELHVRLNRQTIVFDAQNAEELEGEGGLQQTARIPPLDFKTPFNRLRPAREELPMPAHDNPIRESLMRAAEASGEAFNLMWTYPRPVSYAATPAKTLPLAAGMGARLAVPESALQRGAAPEFLWTDVACWNDETPPTERRFVPPKKDDPTRGSPNERRRGPFPVGVAVEVTPPTGWGPGRADKARLAVIGHGAPFAGAELSQVQEKLLLDTCNWLLRRGDLLSKETELWSYPRLARATPEATSVNAAEKPESEPRLTLTEREKSLWLWGARLGLPVLFAWLGLVVLLVRRVR